MFVSFGRNAADEHAASETFPRFNSAYKGTIEWRIETKPGGKPRPFATILRWNVKLEDDERDTTGRVLVVTRLGPGGVCHVGYVDARANPNANELAQQLADQRARTFKCEITSRSWPARSRPACSCRAATRDRFSQKRCPHRGAGIQGDKPDRLNSGQPFQA